MVKAYLKYEPVSQFGIITGTDAVAQVVPVDGPSAKNHDIERKIGARGVLVAAPAADAIVLWNVRQGTPVAKLSDLASLKAGKVTALAVSRSGSFAAVGYSNGVVRVWDIRKAVAGSDSAAISTFSGHKSRVSSLSWSRSETRLASGSGDGDIVLWDAVGERGLFRLRSAHSNEVTSLHFIESHGLDHLVSSSKDGVMKVFESATQHCVQVIVGHRGEIWSSAINSDGTLLCSGSVDSLIRMWTIRDPAADGSQSTENDAPQQDTEAEILQPLGHATRKTSGRTVSLAFGLAGDVEMFAVHGVDKTVELFQVRSPDEAERHRKRRRSRQAEKRKRRTAQRQEGHEDDEEADDLDRVIAKDYLLHLRQFGIGHRSRSVQFVGHTQKQKKSQGRYTTLLVQLHNNSIEMYKVPLAKSTETEVEPSKVNALLVEGHRGDIRAVSMSPKDDARLISVSSSKTMKLWNGREGTCIRTFPLSGYGLCCTFYPQRGSAAGRYAIVGTKEGHLDGVDLSSGESAFSIQGAHGGSVWSLTSLVTNDTFVSGGADKKVHLWDYSSQNTEGPVQNRTLELTEDVLCVRATWNNKLLLVSLLDATVRAIYMDSLKQFLSFYGHKLPVLSVDVSSDNSLMVTGSADKTIKIWGLDFGDCRRSLRAHNESVMCVIFQPFTHYFFSGSRDGSVKYWDADRQDLITELDGSSNEVWSLSVGVDGETLCSANHDRSIRIWSRTDEQVFMEEEREKRMDEMFEAAAAEGEEEARVTPFALGPGDAETETAMAGKRTLDTVKGAEGLLEAMALAEEEKTRLEGDGDEPANPLLLGLSPDVYVLRSLRLVRPADVDQALLVLPLKSAMNLLGFCERWLEADSIAATGTELICRVVLFLIQIHHSQILASGDRGQVARIRNLLHRRLTECRDVMGFNLAALRFWSGELADQDMKPFQNAVGQVRKKARKARSTKAPI